MPDLMLRMSARMPHCATIPKKLIILHYHLRPGGVRRVIEMYLPALAVSGVFDSITLAVGEADDHAWTDFVTPTVKGVPFAIHVEPALAYLTERASDASRIRSELRTFLQRWCNEGSVVWAHNLGLARNILLADELARHSAQTGMPVLSQHHDFWFDNRWARWPVLQANGFGNLKKIACATFAAGAHFVHGAINSADESILAANMPGRTAWLPNPASLGERPSAREIRAAKRWMDRELGHTGPVWIFPTRFLRRKNIAEAVLLTRWLRPEAMLVTTAGVSSPEEAHYARRLEAAAAAGKWAVRFRLLAGRDAESPSVPALLCASDSVLLTSVQEGFGLPFLEAAALGTPLLARRLPNVEPDLDRLGFRFPGVYDDVIVPPGLFDEDAERERQEIVYDGWKRTLPASCRRLAGIPRFLQAHGPGPIPFSSLTPTAQMEVLAQDPKSAWDAARPLNPDLVAAAEAGRQPVAWPKDAEKLVSPTACTERLLEALRAMPSAPVKDSEAVNAQETFIRERLSPQFLYSLLMQS